MEFSRLSFTTETASACIIDGIGRGGTTPEVMQAVAVPKPHNYYYASNERAGEGGLEVGDKVYTWVRPKWRDEIQMLCATQQQL